MLPMGTETPTNFPFCSAGPVLVTKFPRIIPIAIAKNIQNARNRSRRPRLLNAETLVERPSSSCFSTSVTGSWGSPLGRVGTGSDEEFSGTGLDFLESLSLNILTRIVIWEAQCLWLGICGISSSRSLLLSSSGPRYGKNDIGDRKAVDVYDRCDRIYILSVP